MDTVSPSSIVRYVVDSRCLDVNTSYEISKMMLKRELDNIEIAAILTALRVRGECASEIAGFAKAMRESCVRIEVDRPCIDTAGTGGDGYGTVNASTVAALIAAAAGAYVLKHGNRAVSSASGSADFLEALGYNIDHGPEQVKRMVERTRFGFAFAPLFHTLMRNVMPIRRRLGFRTIFNLVGPLSNPGNVKRQLLGVSDSRHLTIMAEACRELRYEHVVLVHGDPGIDEVSAFGKTRVVEVRGDKIESYEVDVSDFGIPRFDVKDVIVDSSRASVEKVMRSLRPGSRLDVVKAFIAVNAGFAMYVADLVKSTVDGFELCLKLIDDGVVAQYVDYVVRTSREV